LMVVPPNALLVRFEGDIVTKVDKRHLSEAGK
jgi:hypothetical protein